MNKHQQIKKDYRDILAKFESCYLQIELLAFRSSSKLIKEAFKESLSKHVERSLKLIKGEQK